MRSTTQRMAGYLITTERQHGQRHHQESQDACRTASSVPRRRGTGPTGSTVWPWRPVRRTISPSPIASSRDPAPSAFYYGIYKPDGGTLPAGNGTDNHGQYDIRAAQGDEHLVRRRHNEHQQEHDLHARCACRHLCAEQHQRDLRRSLVRDLQYLQQQARDVEGDRRWHRPPSSPSMASSSTIPSVTPAGADRKHLQQLHQRLPLHRGMRPVSPSEINGIAVDAYGSDGECLYYNTIYINKDSIVTNPVCGHSCL